MLKGINPLLGPDLLHISRAEGHGDEIAIVDGNYPAVTDARRLVRMDAHGAVALTDAILPVMLLDHGVPAAFRPEINGDAQHVEPIMATLAATISGFEPAVALEPLMGEAFYTRVKSAFALVASGERALYGNVILRKGVIEPEA